MALLPANPGEALWIGPGGGKNHYNVGIGQGTSGGQNHEDFGQDLIEDGYKDDDKFYLNAEGNVIFRINASAGRTSTNTAHPRCELRELTASGGRAEWDGRSGTHYAKGRCRITEVTTNRPWICFAQIHGSEGSPVSSDLIRLQTEGANGTSTNLRIVSRRSPVNGGSEIVTTLRTGYDVGDWFDWEIRMVGGQLIVLLDGVDVLNVSGMAQIKNYFKAGCYLQDNIEKGADPADWGAVEYERGSFVTWHSGYPEPTAPVFTGATDPGGGPGGGDGTADTAPPTVPENGFALRGDTQLSLTWDESTDNVGVTEYKVYRFNAAGGGSGGDGSTSVLGRDESGNGETSSSADKLIASRFTAPADGVLVEGHARLWLSAAGSTDATMYVYADDAGDPGDLLATSDEITVSSTSEGVRDFTFTGAERINIDADTEYWVAVSWDDPGTPSVVYSRDVQASQRTERSDVTYGSPPDPFGTATGVFTGPIDAWCEVVSGTGAGTGGGTTSASFGKETDGATSVSSSTDKMSASLFTATADGVLTEGHARAHVTSESTETRVVVCENSGGAPGEILAISDELVISATSEAVRDYTFSGANQIDIVDGTSYWVGLAWDDPGTGSLVLSRDATASQRVETSTFTYPPTQGGSWGTPSTGFAGPNDVWVDTEETSSATGGWVLIATVTDPEYTDTGLTNGTEYTYAVTALDAAANESNRSTSFIGIPGAPDAVPPSVPTGLDADPGDGRITITWNASTDDDAGVLRYVIYLDGSPAAQVTHGEGFATALVLAGLTNGVELSVTISAVDRALNESAQSSAVLVTPAAPAIDGVTFLPGRLVAGKVEIAIAWGADLSADQDTWTWTDETERVRFDPGLAVALGRNDESSTSNPASLTFVLDNSSGDYSLGGRSVRWPNVRRNTPIRCRIDPGDGGGGRIVILAFADGFTPGWDSLTGEIPVVTVSASGALRRLAQGDAPVTSAYRRVMAASSSVVAYWPMEEGDSASYAPALRGGSNFTFTGGSPDWEADDSFDCSAALPRLSDAYFQATVDAYADTGASQVRFLLSIPDDGLTDGTVLAHISMTGTIHRWDVTYGINAEGVESLGLYRYNESDGSLHSSDIIGFRPNGVPCRFGLDWTQSGSDIVWTMSLTPAIPGAVASFFRRTLAGRTCGIVSAFELNPHNAKVDATIGHITVENAVTSFFAENDALIAHAGELVTGTGGRLFRLCQENGVQYQAYGSGATLGDLDEMGPQLVAPLLDLLHECEDSDQGQLWDGRNAGLSYTTRRRRELGDVALTIDAAAGELADSFEPTHDDQRDRNRVTVTRLHGVTVTKEDSTGPMGTGEIGIYDDAVTINNGNDSMAGQYAYWFVALGTVDGYRYPSVTVDLAASPDLAGAVLDVIPGRRIDVVNLDDTLAAFPDDSVSLIVEGIAHEITTRTWRVTFRCSLFDPWAVGEVAAESGDTSDMLLRLDTDGASVASSASAAATSLSVASTGALWSTDADDYPLQLDVGGVRVRATACSGGASPQTMTVDALPIARAAGLPVRLWRPRVIGLG